MATGGEIQSLLCSICTDVFEDATLLKCGHTFCRQCLVSYDQYQRHVEDAIPCPLCRQQTSLNAARVAGLSSNVTVNSLVEDFNTKSKLYEDPKCTQCHRQSGKSGSSIYAVAFCNQCEIYMCERCLNAHEQLGNTLFATITFCLLKT